MFQNIAAHKAFITGLGITILKMTQRESLDSADWDNEIRIRSFIHDELNHSRDGWTKKNTFAAIEAAKSEFCLTDESVKSMRRAIRNYRSFGI